MLKCFYSLPLPWDLTPDTSCCFPVVTKTNPLFIFVHIITGYLNSSSENPPQSFISPYTYQKSSKTQKPNTTILHHHHKSCYSIYPVNPVKSHIKQGTTTHTIINAPKGYKQLVLHISSLLLKYSTTLGHYPLPWPGLLSWTAPSSLLQLHFPQFLRVTCKEEETKIISA